MTCIVGIETENGVLLGADSIAASGYLAEQRAEAKVFRLGPYLLGFTTSFRMGDLLRYHLALQPPPRTRLHRHMVLAVVPAIRECLKAGGFATMKEGAENGGEFLIAARGLLFSVASDYQVGRSSHGYNAVGCGREPALGALAATVGMDPAERMRRALEAAERHSIGVRRPWRILAERAPS